jgi:hypothetical protein
MLEESCTHVQIQYCMTLCCLSPPPIGQIPPQLDMDYNARKAPIGGEFLRLLQLAAWRRGKLTSRILILLSCCLRRWSIEEGRAVSKSPH